MAATLWTDQRRAASAIKCRAPLRTGDSRRPPLPRETIDTAFSRSRKAAVTFHPAPGTKPSSCGPRHPALACLTRQGRAGRRSRRVPRRWPRPAAGKPPESRASDTYTSAPTPRGGQRRRRRTPRSGQSSRPSAGSSTPLYIHGPTLTFGPGWPPDRGRGDRQSSGEGRGSRWHRARRRGTGEEIRLEKRQRG